MTVQASWQSSRHDSNMGAETMIDTTEPEMRCPGETCQEYARVTRLIEAKQRELYKLLQWREGHAQLLHGVWHPTLGPTTRP